MSVSIKVAIRCRPFTIDDKLGNNLMQIKFTINQLKIQINCRGHNESTF